MLTRGWWHEKRVVIFTGIVVVAFGLLDIRLFWLQVINRPNFTRMAASNRIRIETIEPLRGRILDRNGNLLVENRPSYTLYAQPWIIRKQQGSVMNLAGILQLEPDELRQRISRRGWFTFAPSVLQRDLSWDALAALEAQMIDFPGILFRLESKRRYLCPVAVHILGYIGERDIANPQSGGIRYNLVGKRGLEKTYEKYLGGEPGVKYLEVDANGRLIGEASGKPSIPSQPGWDLYLNIDAKLQEFACELMADRTGAIVAMDPRDGAVLVLVSEPDYDPSLFTGVMPQEVWDELTSDPAKPLLNRAIQGLYPPGSTFKMVDLCAGYSEGVIGENFGVHCPGGLQIGNRWFNCWKHGGHGGMGPIDGLQHSCDVFFYTVGLRLGIERMEKYARELGMGAETGIDLDGESDGVVAGKAYLDRKFGAGKWSKALAANIAIGQGDVLVTPIQLAVYTAALATGDVVSPRLANRFVHPVTGEEMSVEPDIRPVKIDRLILLKVREAMRRVVNEPGGTAFWLKNPEIVIAGKTGTSQNPHGKDHALFVAYAPFDDPTIVVAVVVEHGEHGSSTAAPIAFKLIERYLKGEVKTPSDSALAGTAPLETSGD